MIVFTVTKRDSDMTYVEPDELRKTMRLWASGVTVVTSALGERRLGLTVNAFSSVSLDPPLILVCLQSGTPTLEMIRESDVFAVSLLRDDQGHLSIQFAGFAMLPAGADKFYQVETDTAVTGAPILPHALAWMDCRLHDIYPAGSSNIVVGKVVAIGRQDGGQPLIYHNRVYYSLVPQQASP